MSEIDELIKKHCPNGVEYRELGEVVDYIQPTKFIVESTAYSNDFKTPVLTAGQKFILGYTDETEGIYQASKNKSVIIFDDFTTSNHWVDFNFKVKSSAMKILNLNKEAKCNFRYIYYAIKCIKYKPEEHTRQWISTYSRIKIPIPPIEVQEKVVRILEKFEKITEEITSELKAEIISRKQQYEYYKNKLLTFKVIEKKHKKESI